MEYRNVQSKDIRDIIKIWNSTIIKDKITEDTLIKTIFCDPNYDSDFFKVAVDNGSIVGFIIGMRRIYPYLERGLQSNQAWILSIAVRQDYQHKGIGSTLLKKIEDAWKELNISRITLATYSPNYFFPGICEGYESASQFFIRHKYAKNEPSYWMSRSLLNYRIPKEIVIRKQKKELEGYSFVSFQWKYAFDFIKFLKDNFSVGWRMHAINAINNNEAESTILLCIYKEKVVGYVQRSIDGNPSRFGPFGVKEEFRNEGLGSILIHDMWKSMFDKDIHNVFFKSTDENGRRFYERHGMDVDRVFHHYEKEVQ